MNPTTDPLQKIEEIISKGNTGIIIVPINASHDALAAATSLYLGLTKIGKNVSLACSQPVQNNNLVGADKIQNTLSASGNNLVISFPYSDGSIDKVDYNIQGDYFNIIVTPRPEFPKLNPNQVNYSYSGGTIDFIITVDASNLNALGEIYTNNQVQFQGRNIINIDRHLVNSFFGIANFVQKNISSTSELVLKALRTLRCQIDKDIATNLYSGITMATNNFTSYSVNAETFENAAYLLKLGALKKSVARNTQINQPRTINVSSLNPESPQFEHQAVKPIESVERLNQTEDKKTPQDWLKPKIFHGGGLV